MKLKFLIRIQFIIQIHAIKPGPYEDTTSGFPRTGPSCFLFLFCFDNIGLYFYVLLHGSPTHAI